jgi:type IV pilus assembly protein PilC
MQNFKYTARNLSGEPKSGLHRAENQHEVLLWLREQGLIPLNVESLAAGAGKKKSTSRRRIKSADLATVAWQLATMLDGGLPITTSFELIAEDIENKRLQEVLTEISVDMHSGEALSESMKKHPDVFNHLFISMITAGESGGTMVKSLRRLGQYFDNKDKLIRKVKGALAYPIFVVCFVVLIVIAIMTFIIPRFKAIFDQIGGDLPAFTQGFMNVYDFLVGNMVYLIFLLAAIITFLMVYCKTKTGHYNFSRFMLKIPLIGKVIAQAFIAMFCQTMSTLLGAGVSVLDTLDILATLTTNEVIRNAIVKTREHIIQGSSVSLSMAGSEFFPNMVVKMMQVGEESGSLNEVLDRTSEFYERKVDSTIQLMMTLLEPILIISVGLIIGTVLIALYLPIFSMSDIKK